MHLNFLILFEKGGSRIKTLPAIEMKNTVDKWTEEKKWCEFVLFRFKIKPIEIVIFICYLVSS